jgi:nucleotide-binding universal stress UspA family protein
MIPKKILMCTDFSENSTAARLLTLEYAKAFDAEVVILHVVNSRMFGYPILEQIPVEVSTVRRTIQDGANQELEVLVNDARLSIEKVSGRSLVGAPPEEIVRFAEEEGVDLIIMGAHGWTGVRRLILGSVAENVLRKSPCPVLTVRSEAV